MKENEHRQLYNNGPLGNEGWIKGGENINYKISKLT